MSGWCWRTSPTSGRWSPPAPTAPTCVSRPRCRISTADGTAYVANVGFDLVGGGSLRTAAPMRVDPSGTTTLVADDLHSPNGAVILGDTLVVVETLASRISAFDIRSDGSLSPRAATGRRSGRCPPGARSARCSISSSWRRTASPPAPRARSGRPTRSTGGSCGRGRASSTRSRPEPGASPASSAADDGRTLFLCTAPSFAEHERRDTRLIAARVEVPGLTPNDRCADPVVQRQRRAIADVTTPARTRRRGRRGDPPRPPAGSARRRPASGGPGPPRRARGGRAPGPWHR